MTVLLDTHALLWWSTQDPALSAAARRELTKADELAVAAITWYELAWLTTTGRISTGVPPGPLLTQLARCVRTAPLTPTIATTAAALGTGFPGDPIDRLIYATAIEHGWRLVSKDQRMRAHDSAGRVVVW